MVKKHRFLNGFKQNYQTLLSAADAGALILMECEDMKTGKPVPVLATVHHDGDMLVTTPVARMFEGNPYDFLKPPGCESKERMH